MSSTLSEHHGLPGEPSIVQALWAIPSQVKGNLHLQPSSIRHTGLQSPQLPRMCNPLSSTLVEHHGLPVGEKRGAHPLKVMLEAANVNGKMHFIPELGPATVMQFSVNKVVKPHNEPAVVFGKSGCYWISLNL